MALSRETENKVEVAFEKRRRLMADWARFCEATPAGEVVSLRAGM